MATMKKQSQKIQSIAISMGQDVNAYRALTDQAEFDSRLWIMYHSKWELACDTLRRYCEMFGIDYDALLKSQATAYYG